MACLQARRVVEAPRSMLAMDTDCGTINLRLRHGLGFFLVMEGGAQRSLDSQDILFWLGSWVRKTLRGIPTKDMHTVQGLRLTRHTLEPGPTILNGDHTAAIM